MDCWRCVPRTCFQESFNSAAHKLESRTKYKVIEYEGLIPAEEIDEDGSEMDETEEDASGAEAHGAKEEDHGVRTSDSDMESGDDESASHTLRDILEQFHVIVQLEKSHHERGIKPQTLRDIIEYFRSGSKLRKWAIDQFHTRLTYGCTTRTIWKTIPATRTPGRYRLRM